MAKDRHVNDTILNHDYPKSLRLLDSHEHKSGGGGLYRLGDFRLVLGMGFDVSDTWRWQKVAR